MYIFLPFLPKIFTALLLMLQIVFLLFWPFFGHSSLEIKKSEKEKKKKKIKGKNIGKDSCSVIWGLLVYKPSTFDLAFLLKSERRTSSLWSSPHHVLRNAASPGLWLLKAWMSYCSRFHWLRVGAGLFPSWTIKKDPSHPFFSFVKAAYLFSVFIKEPSMETCRHPERAFQLTQ